MADPTDTTDPTGAADQPTRTTDAVPSLPPAAQCADCGAPVAHQPGTTRLQCTRWQHHQHEFVTVHRDIRGHPYHAWVPGQAVEPEAVVPFALDQAAAAAVVRTWLGSRRFAPQALREVTDPESVQSTYLPYWSFSADTRSDYRGKRGKHYWTTETHTTTDAQGNSRTDTRSVQHTSWKRTEGTVTRSFNDILVAATGQVAPGQLAKVSPWPLPAAVPYQPEYGYGHHTLPYDVPLDAGLDHAKQVMAKDIEADCRNHIGGDAQQVDSVQTHYPTVTYRLLLFPAWIGSYRYRDKTWQVLVNGHTGAVHGERPYSVGKILATVAAVLAAVAAIIALFVLNGAGR